MRVFCVFGFHVILSLSLSLTHSLYMLHNPKNDVNHLSGAMTESKFPLDMWWRRYGNGNGNFVHFSVYVREKMLYYYCLIHHSKMSAWRHSFFSTKYYERQWDRKIDLKAHSILNCELRYRYLLIKMYHILFVYYVGT